MRRPHSYSHSWLAAMIVAALGLLAGPVGAAETDDDTDTAVAQAHESAGEEAHGQAVEHGAEHAEHGEEHGEHAEHAKNGLALFLGGTVETAEDETFFTIGGEYERHLADRWGVQLVVEHVNDFDAWVVIAPVGFRLVDKLWFVTGPGLETESRRNEEHDGGHDVVEHSAEIHGEEEGGPFFLWRFGLGYSFHLGHSFGVMPSVNFDVVREHGEWAEAWVLGVSLTYHF